MHYSIVVTPRCSLHPLVGRPWFYKSHVIRHALSKQGKSILWDLGSIVHFDLTRFDKNSLSYSIFSDGKETTEMLCEFHCCVFLSLWGYFYHF